MSRTARTCLVLLALFGAACGPATPAPSATTAPPKPAVSPAAAAPAKAEPAEWEKQWNALIEAAKREGKVVVNGPPIPEARTNIPGKFKERFGIEVEYNGGSDNDLSRKVEGERAAGQFTLDVAFGGPSDLITKYHANQWMEPLRPILIHPEVTDNAKWKSGKLWFSDPEGIYVLRLVNSVNAFVAVNTSKVNLDDLKTLVGLLEPKYKGMIQGEDPTVPGGGANSAAYMYSVLGEDFIKKLYLDQQMRLSRDRREIGDGLGRGTFPVNIGLSNADAEYANLVKQGFPVKVLAGFADAPGYLGAGSGLMRLMNSGPHPNAAKLFVNWMASKEGVEIYARAEQKASLRTDIDESWLPEYTLPEPGVNYFDTYGWDYAKDERPKVVARVRELLSR